MTASSIAHRGLFAFAFVMGLAANAPTAQAEGTLSEVATYDDGTVKVELDDYTDGPQVVALMGMKGNGVSISFAFDQAEWPKLLAIWTDALAKTGPDFTTAGSLTEVGSSAQCVITMAGGPAIRITIVDPTAGSLVYTVAPGDLATFDQALRQTGDAATLVN
jgi:hypothetical protein